MNTIPKDPYANELLLNIKISIPGAVITRDAYAEALLNGAQDGAGTFLFPTDDKAPTYIASKDLGKQL